MKFRLLLLVLGLLWSCFGYAEGNIEAGASKNANCVACHGPDGNSLAPLWPKIAGQHEAYLVKQIKEIRMGEEGPRHNETMYPMVQNLTDQDILDLAAFYANQEQTSGQTKSAYLEPGAKIYRGGILDKGIASCSGCHGPRGKGNDLAGFPRLSGQHADYTVDQLKAFKEGRRKNDINGIMRDIAMRMSEEDMRAVAEYVAGLH